MCRQILLLLAVLTPGLATSQRWDKMPCKMVDKEVSCQGLGLLQVPSLLPPDIEALDLSRNQLRSVLAAPLGFYTALHRLDLSANEIDFLQPGALQALPRLEHLNLAHNHLAAGSEPGGGGLGPLPRLAALDLSGNSLYSELLERLLGEAPALRALSLAENSLTRLTRRTFRGVPALERLDLHSNVLMDIEEGAFDALPRLAHLNLSRNSLTCISDFRLQQLRVLDLSSNSIEAFQTAPEPRARYQLTWLDLRENKLLRFPDLAGLPSLAFLNVSNNLIRLPAGPARGGESVPAPAEGWPASPLSNRSARAHPLAQLLNLDLSYNEIEQVPEGFLERLTSLRSLNLSRNCLRAFEARRAGALPCLGLLDLSHNALEVLELGAGALGALRTLLLQENALRQLPADAFAGLASLQRLNLRGNRVRPCGGPGAPAPSGCVAFSGIPSLRVLSLVDNEVGTLGAGAFLGTPLTELDLSANPGLQVAAGALAGLEASLEVLELQGNGLTTLQVDLPCFSCLKRLNLAENRLSRLPAWTQAVSLEVLDLRNNSFSLLPGSAMGGLEPSLRRLYLQGNPLSCCGNGWLAAQLHRGRVDVDARRGLICRFGSQEEVALSHVRPEDCEKGELRNVNLIVILTFAVVSAALLTTLATCCVVRRQKFSQQYKA
ncbi:transforming growth factor beta activator LRRC32 [Dasypus novemcinctus]|uniref:transforming growth factor beta activator LRRC32 n=1 Tax=Dasypus novemcinctus TaxID=9361 RepID=UPI00265E8719|nr:transforming growth factor beta activator LRRC32 [Dasypus novemcinctus]XP_004451028.2 transforming growth factor beta activator LRRC32 [Dasypus novemcinctus]XP_004451029.2 transforming growth factor beta activator LRRC32 [Dasypus novemcinctus]XP_004451030.2 transforming growth factor beta activator LRRC32 [Dasypus novemcinctus]XP_004451031.2 transforming growth factor beta activator LRRC32 [Dasypus novemcinctus]XP_004451032.2 transforming growth factor beta activator LRRC32 [Dasypus novemci